MPTAVGNSFTRSPHTTINAGGEYRLPFEIGTFALSGDIETSWTGLPDVWAASTYIPPGEAINIVLMVGGKKSMHH